MQLGRDLGVRSQLAEGTSFQAHDVMRLWRHGRLRVQHRSAHERWSSLWMLHDVCVSIVALIKVCIMVSWVTSVAGDVISALVFCCSFVMRLERHR